jgi:phage gpG-like protein
VSSVQGMDALIKRLAAIGEPKPLLRALQLSTIHEAQALVPRKTGLLQRRIIPGAITNDHAIVKADTPYAAPVEFGSKPHIMKPRNGKVLAWGGARRLSGRLRTGAKPTNFATIVHHPGSRAHPYLIPGAKKATGGLKDLIVTRWNSAA